ncbi:MAG: C40 family peptidase [Flavipsychrobacter sp.]|nr:C40 family peptidase [Flavipsychrobacter sp.]
MVLSFAYCNSSRSPVRLEPSHRSEQVTELLFGERAEILEINDKDWARVKAEWDGYEGWSKLSQLTVVSRKAYNKAPRHLVARNGDKLVFPQSEMWLPMGADLYPLKGGKLTVGNEQGRYKGKKLDYPALELTKDTIKAAALHYLHAPYVWGGRTITGIDCSGLTQMAYKLCGKAIPRDASQQAELGETVDFLQHTHAGDLAFFDNAEGKITHVGLLLNDHTIIHATDAGGCVVIDKIDQGGIISVLHRKRTHNLRLVKRYF